MKKMLNSKMDNKNIGLLKGLYCLRAELDVYCLISVNAESIKRKGAGKSFWGFLQKSYIDLIALSICKIFECEKQNKKGEVKYELNSIDGVLRHLVNEKPSALDSSQVCGFIRKYGRSPNEDELLSGLSLTVAGFKGKYQKELDRFKNLRDKGVAHSEFKAAHSVSESNIDLPSYDVMERLFNFGADFYMLVSAAFVSVVPCDLNSDRKVKVGLKRVLHEFGLTDIKTEME
jgi:hypothetical protein